MATTISSKEKHASRAEKNGAVASSRDSKTSTGAKEKGNKWLHQFIYRYDLYCNSGTANSNQSSIQISEIYVFYFLCLGILDLSL